MCTEERNSACIIRDEKAFMEFVEAHAGEDANQLRLKKWKEVPFPIELAITQIAVRKKLATKLPSIAAKIIVPSELSAEQCSSEATATYKRNLVVGETLCDLTGGLGIDCYYMSQKAQSTTYIEQNEFYSRLARRNFACLGRTDIMVVNADSTAFLRETYSIYDTLYIDPARRDDYNNRMYALAHCTPNVLELLPTMLSKSHRIILKASTMVDIGQLRKELAVDNVEIHIVSVRNECKEVLAVIDPAAIRESSLICSMINGRNSVQTCRFAADAEGTAPQRIAACIGRYLYEPDAALMKAGVFKSIAERYNAGQLHPNSHLYTSDHLIEDFPGRKFEVSEVIEFSSKVCKTLSQRYPMCNIAARNFPLAANRLREKLRIKDGGDTYMFATTITGEKRVLIVCHKASHEA